MTRVEVLNLQAGRELDALIHSKVLGKVVTRGSHGYYWTDEVGLLGANPVPKYSSEIQFAWQMVEGWSSSFSQGGPSIEILIGGNYTVFIRAHHSGYLIAEATGDTAPLAICRAALLTVGDKT